MIVSTLLLSLFVTGELRALLEQARLSGRVASIAEPPSERIHSTLRLTPGDPPILRFRLLEGKDRHRFGDLDLVMDDAGH